MSDWVRAFAVVRAPELNALTVVLAELIGAIWPTAGLDVDFPA